ncbi:MAG: hypothetical protein PUG22_04465, partial [Peptoniphilaceae bacterium]|nr:hypothetical protein [Peptoniphilaceae bacterium]
KNKNKNKNKSKDKDIDYCINNNNISSSSSCNNNINLDIKNKIKKQIKKQNNSFDDDDEEDILNLSEQEELVLSYYYDNVKNNANRTDFTQVLSAIRLYGRKKVLYTLVYLHEDKDVKVTSFNYVETTLENMKPVKQEIIEYIANSTIDAMKAGEIHE